MSITPTQPDNKVLHTIAFFEGFKGITALLVSVGLLSLVHHDVRAIAYALIGHFHINPDSHYPKMVLDDLSLLTDSNLRQVVFMTWAYAAVRLIEGYGLWKDLEWAEWLATLSGTIYLPWEVRHLLHQTSIANGLVLIGNTMVIVYMTIRLIQRKKQTDSYPVR